MTVQMIPARNCLLSARNVRRTAADPARLETLKASIEARGVLQNLIGFAVPKKRGKFEITAGGRRLAAVQGLIAAGTLATDYELPVFVMNDTSAAAETSLAENFERQAMNPADECVAFRHFIEVEGATVEDVARRFGLTTRFVEGRIRLAGLAEDVFEALRAGEIGVDVAQAFGTTTDTARQTRVYEQLKGSYNGISPVAVRRLMTDETVTGANAMAKLVGRDAYVEAGGRIESDLFADGADEIWLDRAILTTLAEVKMTEAAARIGGFAAVVPVLGNRPDWQQTEALRPVYAAPVPPTPEQQARLDAIATELETIEAQTEQSGATDEMETRFEALTAEAETIERARPMEIDPEVRSAATAFLVIGADGTPTVHSSIYLENTVRPASERQGGPAGEDVTEGAAIGKTLRDELAVQRTQLLELHVASDAGMAIDLAIFLLADAKVSQGRSFDRGSSLSGSKPTRAPFDYKPSGPVVDQLQTMHDGLDHSWAESADTGARFDAFRALDDEQRGAWAGWVVAQTLEAKLADESYSAFHNHLGRTMGIDVAAWWRPTAANFFGRVKKTVVLDAMTTIGGAELAGRYANAKKADIAEAAEKLCGGKTIVEASVRIAAQNWLPPVMTFGTVASDATLSDEAGNEPDGDGADAGDETIDDDDGDETVGRSNDLEEAA